MPRHSAGTVTFTLQGVEEALREADPLIVGKAATSTINKIGRSALATASQEIRKVWNVQKRTLDDRVKLARATQRNALQAVITFSGKSVSLSYFGARQMMGSAVLFRKNRGGGLVTKTNKRRSKFQGVVVEVKRGSKTYYKSSFMQTFKSGHVGILYRTGKGRYPVKVHAAVSIAHMTRTPAVAHSVERKVEDNFERTFAHELEYYRGK